MTSLPAPSDTDAKNPAGRFLLVSPRSGEAVARAEFADFISASGLGEDQLDHIVIDKVGVTVGDVTGYAGVFIGGSPLCVTTPEYDDYQRHVHQELAQLIDCAVPSFFVCFGAGFVTDALGGHVGRTHPEQSGPTRVELTTAGRLDPLLKGLPAEFSALTGHTENIIIPALECEVLATALSCPTQMFRVGAHTWASQFHADMDPAAMVTRMDFYRTYGYFSPEDYDDIVATIADLDTAAANAILANFVTFCLTRE